MNYTEAISKIESYKNFVDQKFRQKGDNVIYNVKHITALRSDNVFAGNFKNMKDITHLQSIVNEDLYIAFILDGPEFLGYDTILVKEADFFNSYYQ